MLQPRRVLQDRYLIEKQIGAGGMGAVYLAIDQETETTVAIKETISADLRLGRAFEREAQLLSILRHPALPRVMNYFTEGEGQFIVMEYIAGDDLSEIVDRKEPYPVADVLRWADELLDALDYLHNQKVPVVHRDIKPQNLKLKSNGKIVLLDFGLAKGTPNDLSRLTMTKSIFGYSRNYAPLEQIQGKGTDPRSDLYALGATLYHLMTGEPPLDALTRATAVLSGEVDLLKKADVINPQIPAAVSEILHQALALNPSLRPETAVAMRFALREAAQTESEPPKAQAATVNSQYGFTAPPLRKSFETQIVEEADKTVPPKHTVTVKQPPVRKSVKPAPPKKPVWTYFATPMRITIGVLLVGVIALALSINRSEHTQAVDSATFDKRIEADKDKPAVQVETQPIAVAEPEQAENKEAEKPLEAKQPEITEKPETVVQTPAKKRTRAAAPEDTIALEQEEEEPVYEPPVRRTEPVKREEPQPVKQEKRKGGIGGIFKKIGEGVKDVPKIFKKDKKDKKDSD
jgi:serine/threonine protein kinase